MLDMADVFRPLCDLHEWLGVKYQVTDWLRLTNFESVGERGEREGGKEGGVKCFGALCVRARERVCVCVCVFGL